MPRAATANPKKSVNVTLRADLLKQARQAKLNLSAVLDRAIAQELQGIGQQRWLKENKPAFQAYNERIEKHGLFSEGQRAF